MKQNVTKMIEIARGHVEAGGFRPAEVYYRHVIKACDPPTSSIDRLALGEACWFMASRAVAVGRHGEACDWYQRALFADPLAVDYMIQFVIKALLPMAMFRNAKIIATRAAKIEPENKDAWRILGIACAALNESDESVAAYERQLELDPFNPLAVLDRTTIAINTGDHDTAARLAKDILNNPIWIKHHGDAWHVIALCAYRTAQHEDAIGFFNQALEFGTMDDKQVIWNKSLALHAAGQYASGWKLSEARGEQQADEPMRLVMNRFQRPRMTPADLDKPQRVHVHHEMGSGDAFAMVRYLDLLVERGHDVRLEAMDSMVELLQRSFPKVKVMPRALDYPGAVGIPEFDVHVPTLSLPALFETDIDTVPWRGPYIKPTQRIWDKMGRRIGICWSSGIRNDGLWISEYGRRKSMSFETFKPIVDAIISSGAFPVSLQVGPERAQMFGQVEDALSPKPDWDETATLIDTLDLVITVDTAVAHLAGAMEKPVWVLCQRDGSTWHFMRWTEGALWNERSPWYPSARVVRQREFNRPHHWADVVKDVAEALCLGLQPVSASSPSWLSPPHGSLEENPARSTSDSPPAASSTPQPAQ